MREPPVRSFSVWMFLSMTFPEEKWGKVERKG